MHKLCISLHRKEFMLDFIFQVTCIFLGMSWENPRYKTRNGQTRKCLQTHSNPRCLGINRTDSEHNTSTGLAKETDPASQIL